MEYTSTPSPLLSILEPTYRTLRVGFRWVTSAQGGRAAPLGSSPELATVPRSEVDLFVSGFAYSGAGDASTGRVRVRCGSIDRTLHVFGRRSCSFDGSSPRIHAPAPFERVPLSRESAYGGGPELDLYPRNPLGMGYVLAEHAPRTVDLPMIEEGDDLLTPDRVLVEKPSRWWAQPIPALLQPISPFEFPRSVLLDPWTLLDLAALPADERLPEVRMGDLDPGYAAPEHRPILSGLQEAPRRSRIREWAPGLEVVLSGCVAGGGEWKWRVPEAPPVTVVEEGRRALVQPRAVSLTLLPETQALSIVYCADHALARVFVPGIHRRIPITVQVGAEEPAAFPTPAPIRDRRVERNGA